MLYSAYSAAVLALLLVALSINVSRLRITHKISFGDGGIKALTAAVRAHGNTLEQSIIFVPLLYFVETNARLDPRVLLGMALVFVSMRLVYCAALFARILRVRQVAHILTVVLQIAAACLILAH